MGTAGRVQPGNVPSVVDQPQWTLAVTPLGDGRRPAFPSETAPQFLLRDRDRIFGKGLRGSDDGDGLQKVPSAPRSPWQRAYLERVIDTIRRKCLDA